MSDQPSLTIELVPSTCWYSNVRSHVSRRGWETCKRFVRQRSGDRCEVCGGRGQRWPVECHEVWSYHEAVDRDVVTLRVQRLDGLIALCPACHEVKHIGLTEIRGRLPTAVDHLARVNGWTADDALAYVESCVEVWAQRSQHEWELDVSWLATIGVTVPSSPSR